MVKLPFRIISRVARLARMVDRCRRERGMALLATMMAIALMTIIVVDFTSSSALGYLSAANNANEIRASYLARSAINVGLALIAQDTRAQLRRRAASGRQGSPTTSTQQGSPRPPPGKGSLSIRTPAYGRFRFRRCRSTAGLIGLSVVDEARKFNINKLINTQPGIGGLGRHDARRYQHPAGRQRAGGRDHGRRPTAANAATIVGQPNPIAITQFTNLVNNLGPGPGDRSADCRLAGSGQYRIAGWSGIRLLFGSETALRSRATVRCRRWETCAWSRASTTRPSRSCAIM